MDSYGGTSIESGDIIKSNCKIKAELGEVIGGTKSGRESIDAVTIYKSLGLAVQDLAAAKLITDVSRSSNSRIPIKREKWTDTEIKDAKTIVNVKSTETTCEAKHVTFKCRASFYPTLDSITCEIIITKNDGGCVCFAKCFLYEASNGQLLALLDDWSQDAPAETKAGVILSINNKKISLK